MKKDVVRQPPRKITDKHFLTLPDAVQDGKFIANVGDEIVASRVRDGRHLKCVCVVKEIEGTRVNTFDMTVEQWFTFNVEDLDKFGIVVKKLSRDQK